jgi:hypothetical protein
MMNSTFAITKDSKQYNGTPTAIFANMADAKIQVNVEINARLNIMHCTLNASGVARLTLKQLANGTPIGASTTTLFSSLATNLDGYSAALVWDEENMRKANMSIWMQYYEQQFVVPRSRTYFTEYSLTQAIDDNAIQATASTIALGNGRRGLQTVVDSLNDIAAGLTDSSANPEISQASAIDDQSFASALVNPTVVTTVLDFGGEELNTMNESTRLTEIHGRFRARFLSMVAQLFAKSLMLNQYKGGETPVIKAWVHSTIGDIVIGILDYHPDLKDRAATATGADFSMSLPNGYRLDVIKTNLDCMQGRLFAVPVIESDMESILSAGHIRDCGTVTVNYTPTSNGAAVRRIATTTREIVMMTNKVGICMDIHGLQAQLGAFNYAPVLLNADSSASLAI